MSEPAAVEVVVAEVELLELCAGSLGDAEAPGVVVVVLLVVAGLLDVVVVDGGGRVVVVVVVVLVVVDGLPLFDCPPP